MPMAKAEIRLQPVGDLRGLDPRRKARAGGKTFLNRHGAKVRRAFSGLGLNIVQIGLKAHPCAAQDMPRRSISRGVPWLITLA